MLPDAATVTALLTPGLWDLNFVEIEIQSGQVVQINLRPADYRSARGLVMRTYRWATRNGKVLDILWINGTRDVGVPAEYFLPVD